METGTLLRFDADRGFGFIAPDSGDGKDLFMHVSGLEDPGDQYKIKPGHTKVQFRRAATDKGPKAIRVSIIDGAGGQQPVVEYEDDEPYDDGEAVMPTVQAWQQLWDEFSKTAFESFMELARANGWVR